MAALDWAFVALPLAALYLVTRFYGLWILEVCAAPCLFFIFYFFLFDSRKVTLRRIQG
jgi:hypothetical protein